MPFQYQLVVSPWVQEQLYARLAESGEESLRAFLPQLWVEAVDNPATRRRAIEIAKKQAQMKHGDK